MNVGEILNVASNKAYQNCLSVFKEYGIPPSLAIFVMDRVYKLVQESALNETADNLSKLTVEHEKLRSTLSEEEKQ